MQLSTLERLQCPQKACKGRLLPQKGDLDSGTLACQSCRAEYPILAGVAILVPEPERYIVEHVKGICQWVADAEIPKGLRREYLLCKRSLQKSHVEEDLESERVNALYFMTHFLGTQEVLVGVKSPQVRDLIEKYWDQGPFSVVKNWVQALDPSAEQRVVELGCGVGGLAHHLASSVSEYLGVDSSFASIALARALYLKAGRKIKIQNLPSDLLLGPTPRPYELEPLISNLSIPRRIDFIVGHVEAVPLRHESFDGSIVLNAIDMLDEPKLLPLIQKRLVKSNGFAIQSAPYIWHEQVAARLRGKKLTGQTSAQVVESMYLQCGFKIDHRVDSIPWVFFKHLRQVELYSVHAFLAHV